MNKLGEVFNFTADDLAANENGYTTYRQRKTLAIRYTKTIIGGFLLFSGAFGVVPALLLSGDDVDFLTGFGRLARGCLLPLGILCTLVIGYNLFHLYASKRRIKTICGIAILSNSISGDKLSYRLQVAGKEILEITESQFKVLRNGELYCLHLLPFGSQILSIKGIPRVPDNPFIEPLTIHPAADDHHSRILRSVFNFSPKDLAENEAGVLTQHQYRQVLVKSCEGFFLWIVAWLILGGFITVIGLVVNHANDRPLLYEFEAMAVLLLPIIPGLMGLLYRWQQAKHDIRLGKVEEICGLLRREALQGMKFSNYFSIFIANQQFDASGQAINTVEAGKTYCAYFAPKTRVIVSIKKVD